MDSIITTGAQRMPSQVTPQATRDDLKPSVKQVYALCRALCRKHGVAFPTNRVEASKLIDSLKHGC